MRKLQTVLLLFCLHKVSELISGHVHRLHTQTEKGEGVRRTRVGERETETEKLEREKTFTFRFEMWKNVKNLAL